MKLKIPLPASPPVRSLIVSLKTGGFQTDMMGANVIPDRAEERSGIHEMIFHAKHAKHHKVKISGLTN